MGLGSVIGELTFSGDKSLSHRAVIFASMCQGTSHIKNFLCAGDTQNTLKAVKQLGAKMSGEICEDGFTITSKGMAMFHSPQGVLDVGNSGTAARLLLGLIGGSKNIIATIDGDESLRKRPMNRITESLKRFGAKFDRKVHLPIIVHGKQLKPMFFEEELGSAQVKSACILGGIASQAELTIIEKKNSRDHTENMLQFMGLPIEIGLKDGFRSIQLHPPYELKPCNFEIWGDISSAAFFIALACFIEGSELLIKDVLLSKYRTGYLNVLKRMGADITFFEKPNRCGEKGGDIMVRHAPLKNISIKQDEITSIIDEIPILAIVASLSQGVFEIRGAQELRYKESDRISSLCSNLKSLGYECEEYLDGFSLFGNPDHVPQGNVDGYLDHRIIMSFEVMNKILNARFPNRGNFMLFTKYDKNKKWIQTSFPTFYDNLSEVTNQ